MAASPPSANRFQIVDRPFASPGKCAGCGCVDRPVVDTKVDILGYGVIYFCVSCLQEIALTIDMVPRDVLNMANAAAAQSFDLYIEQNNLKVISSEQYDSTLSALLILRNAFDGSNVSDVDEATEADATPDSKESRIKPESGKDANRKSRQDNRSASNSRPVSVSADSSDGSDLFNLD